jgi:hypothetical protein
MFHILEFIPSFYGMFSLICETTFPQYMELSSLLIIRPPHMALLSDISCMGSLNLHSFPSHAIYAPMNGGLLLPSRPKALPTKYFIYRSLPSHTYNPPLLLCRYRLPPSIVHGYQTHSRAHFPAKHCTAISAFIASVLDIRRLRKGDPYRLHRGGLVQHNRSYFTRRTISENGSYLHSSNCILIKNPVPVYHTSDSFLHPVSNCCSLILTTPMDVATFHSRAVVFIRS